MIPERISIVGASAAGVSAAQALRSHGYAGRIALIDADPRLPYERPPLSKTDATTALIPILAERDYVSLDIDLLLGVAVTALDRTAGAITVSNGASISTDAVLVSTGVRARRLQVAGSELANILTLRDAEDASQVHARLAAGGPLVIVGGGFIGLELAAVARSHGIDVTVVEREPVPLAHAIGGELAAWLTHHHRAHGVRFSTGTTVREFGGVDGEVQSVTLSDGTTLDAATVVVGVGVEPATQLAESARIHCDAGIVVDRGCRTSAENVFAAGDIASRPRQRGLGRRRIEHWDSAVRHGATAAASMLGLRTADEPTPYFWSDQYDLMVQMFGQREAGDTYVSRPLTENTALGFWLHGGLLQSAVGVGASKDLRAARTLIENRIPVTAEQLADPAVNLRSLAKKPSNLSLTPEEARTCLG